MADFKVLRGTTIISSGNSTATITEGTDYTLESGVSINDAFIRIVNTRLTGMGKTSGGGSQNSVSFTVEIDNPNNLLTSITFHRYLNVSNDCRVTWEIIQYTGSSGGANEIIIRDVGNVVTSGTTATVDGSTVTTISDKDKCCVFITGQSLDHDNRGDWWENLFTADLIASGQDWIPRFTRGKSSSYLGRISYAVVEFAGSNWRDVQRVEFTNTGSAWSKSSQDASFTKSIPTTLLDASKTFLHIQYQTNNDATGLDDAGDCIELTTSTTQLTVRNRSTSGTRTKVVWIMENTQSGSGEMSVQHLSFYEGTGGSEEKNVDKTISSVTLDETCIMGECCSSDGGGTAYPRGSCDVRITSTTNVRFTWSDNGQEHRIGCDIVQLPTAIGLVQVELLDTLDLTDAKTTHQKTSIEESLSLADERDSNIGTILSNILNTIDEKSTKISTLSEDSVTSIDSVQSVVKKLLKDSTLLTDIKTSKNLLQLLDTSQITDSLGKVVNYVKFLQDTINTTDEIKKSLYHVINETLSITDLVTSDISSLLSDNVSLSEEEQTNLLLNFENTIEITEQLSKLSTLKKTLSDITNLTDELLQRFKYLLEDITNLTDEVSKISTFKKQLNDIPILSDTLIGKIATLLQNTVTTTDSVNIRYIIHVLVEDLINVTEVMTKLLSFKKSLIDNIEVLDEFTKISQFYSILTDNISLIDSLLMKFSVLVSSVVNLIDSGVIYSVIQLLEDNISISDAITKSSLYKKFLEDTTLSSDEISLRTTLVSVLEDVVSLRDTLLKLTTLKTTLEDSVTLSDQIDSLRRLRQSLEDIIETTDSLISKILLSLKDQVGLFEEQSLLIKNLLSDLINISDSLSSLIPYLGLLLGELQILELLGELEIQELKEEMEIKEQRGTLEILEQKGELSIEEE